MKKTIKNQNQETRIRKIKPSDTVDKKEQTYIMKNNSNKQRRRGRRNPRNNYSRTIELNVEFIILKIIVIALLALLVTTLTAKTVMTRIGTKRSTSETEFVGQIYLFIYIYGDLGYTCVEATSASSDTFTYSIDLMSTFEEEIGYSMIFDLTVAETEPSYTGGIGNNLTASLDWEETTAPDDSANYAVYYRSNVTELEVTTLSLETFLTDNEGLGMRLIRAGPLKNP